VGGRPGRHPWLRHRGNVLIGTEEDFTTPCGNSGRIVASDLTDSWGGEPAQRSTRTDPYRMKTPDSFHPFIDTPETANPSLGCSAHYFEIEGPLLGAAWYGQGLRLVDIHDARNMRQVGYYRVTNPNPSEPATSPSSNSWDMEFKSDRRRGDLIYLFDMSRGVEVLRLKNGVAAASSMRAVTAPSVRSDPGAAKPVGALAQASRPGGGVTYVCPLFAR
jgi:hypothetical protein